MKTNRNLDIIYYNRVTIVDLPILNIYWQDIFFIRLSHDLCVTHVWLVDALPKGLHPLANMRDTQIMWESNNEFVLPIEI